MVSSLNEDMLRDIASSGDGLYIRATNANAGFSQILDELSGLEKSEFETQVYTDYEDRFQFFIGAAVILFLIALLISEKRSKLVNKINLFEE